MIYNPFKSKSITNRCSRCDAYVEGMVEGEFCEACRDFNKDIFIINTSRDKKLARKQINSVLNKKFPKNNIGNVKGAGNRNRGALPRYMEDK